MLVIPMIDPLAQSFVLPVTMMHDGKKTLCLESIWRARNWRDDVSEICSRIINDRSLETVEITDVAGDLDQVRVFDAILRHPRIKVVKIRGGQVDPHTLSRLLAMDNIERITFENTRFEDAEASALIIKMNWKKLKSIAFHWEDNGDHDKAVIRSANVHSSLQTLAVGFLSDCWKVEMGVV